MTLDLNFTTKNKNLSIFIDIGNQLIKIGYLNTKNKWEIIKLPTRNINVTDLDNVFKHLDISTVYLGSVVKGVQVFLINYFNQNNIYYEIIDNQLFINELNMDQKINPQEVGTDIFGFAYLIRDYKDVLAINFGTATVAINYDQKINGVSIGIDFFNSYKNLLEMIHIPLKLGVYGNFGLNTSDAFNSSRYLLINGFINEMIKLMPNIKRIIYTGGNREIFKSFRNEQNLEIIEIDEAVLKGYKELIYKIKNY